MEKTLNQKACECIVTLLRASGPCDRADIALELRDQCIGVDWANLQSVYETAMARLIDMQVVELYECDTPHAYCVNPFMYDEDGHWAGRTDY